MKSLLVVLLLAGWWAPVLPAQGSATGWEQLAEAFNQAVQEGESATAHSMLAALMQSDSSRAHELAASATLLLATPGASHRQTDTLMRIFDLGLRHDHGSSGPWLSNKALLSIRYPRYYYDTRDQLCARALTEAPLETPLLVTEDYMVQAIRSYQARNSNLKALASHWQIAASQLLLREMLRPETAQETSALRNKLLAQLRAVAPDCQQLEARYAQAATESEAEQILILFQLQACWNAPIWESAMARLQNHQTKAWHFRIAGERALNNGQPALAAQHWQEALRLEPVEVLQALDHLQVAEALAELQEYRDARTHIRRAMELHPHWGEPYMRLCNLYLAGAEQCKLSSFDRKALRWLLTDLCKEARNVDPSYELEAGRRIFQYQQESPSAQEISFRGLREGDTWPLKCWMSTVTTVKIN